MFNYEKQAALVVIDMQVGFDDPAWGPRNNIDCEFNVATLLKVWRELAAPIAHVHHHSSSPSGSFRPGTPGCEPKALALPRADEGIYQKRVNSAFIGTTLERDLRQQSISRLIIVGLTTNHCVSTSVRMAGNLGFETFVVSDATATFDRAGANGHMRSADEVHDAALGDLQGEFAQVIDTKTAIAILGRAQTESAEL